MAHQTVSTAWDEELTPTLGGRTNAPSSDCPVEVAVSAISGRWTTLILRNLMAADSCQYSELKRSLPALSDKVLTERLDELVSAGLVMRTRMRAFPQRTHYRLSERGRMLRPLLLELYRTGLELQAGSTDAGRPESDNGAS